MINILCLALYGPKAASTRYRILQYIPGLLAEDIKFDVHYLLNDKYLNSKFNNEKFSLLNLLYSTIDRLYTLVNQCNYDLIFIHCELIPFLPAYFESLLIRRPYIYDFDDAFYLKYRLGKYKYSQKILGNKFDRIISNAKAITAGNKYLFEYARLYNKNVEYLPTVVNTKIYKIKENTNYSEVFNIGWIGSPSTVGYLNEIISPLSILGLECNINLIIIGAKFKEIPNVNVIEIDWNENTVINQINSFDVGIMPLPDNEWTRGKCAFKLIQYMACALPVVASAVGANLDVVDYNSGYLVRSNEEWLSSLRELRDDPDKRISMGIYGRKIVSQNYSLNRTLPLMTNIIKSLF